MTLWVEAHEGELPSYQATKFGGHSHPGSGVIMILFCHVIPQDYAIKRSSEFMGRTISW